MSVCTAIASGNWSAASGVWSGGSGTGGVPAAGDSIVIYTPNVITIDTNTVLVTTISGTGTLQVSTVAGSYTLNCNNGISVTNFLAGTSGTPLPATVDFEVQLQTNNGAISTNGCQLYGAPNPTGTPITISTSAISSINPANTTIVTATAHNLVAGMQVNISGHATNTGINGYWTVMRVNSTTSFDIGYMTVTGGTGGSVYHCKLTGFLTSACNGSTTVQVAGDFTGWNTLIQGLPAGRANCWINRYTAQSYGTWANCEATLSRATPITYNSGTNTSTITLASALPENKEIGSSITFNCRNILLQSTGTIVCKTLTNAVTTYCEFYSSNGYGVYYGTGHNATGASFIGNSGGVFYGTGHNATGASFSGNSGGVFYGTGHNATGASFSGNSSGVYYGTGHNATGASFSGNTYGVYNGTGHNATGASFSGNSGGVYSGTGHNATGASFSGNYYGVYNGTGHNATGASFSGNTYGVYVSIVSLFSCLFSGNTSGDMIGNKDAQLINCTLSSSTQASYTAVEPLLTNRWRTISYNDGGVAGAIKSWTLGCSTNYPNITVPTGSQPGVQYAAMYTHLMTLINALSPGWYDSRPITLPPNRRYVATWWGQKSANGMVATPQVQLVDLFNDPLVVSGATPLTSATMTDNTGTWQLFQIAYTNTGTSSLSIVIRTIAQNGSGTMNFQYLERSYGNGGLV